MAGEHGRSAGRAGTAATQAAASPARTGVAQGAALSAAVAVVAQEATGRQRLPTAAMPTAAGTRVEMPKHKRLAAALKELERVRTKMEALENELNAARASDEALKIKGLERDRDAALCEAAELTAEVARLVQTVMEKAEEVEAAEQQAKEWKQKAADLQCELAAAQKAEVAAANETAEYKRGFIKGMESAHTAGAKQRTAEVQQLQRKVKTKEAELAAAVQQVKEWQEKADELGDWGRRLQTDLAATKARESDFEASARLLEIKLAKAKKKEDLLAQECKDWYQMAKDANAEAKRLQGELEAVTHERQAQEGQRAKKRRLCGTNDEASTGYFGIGACRVIGVFRAAVQKPAEQEHTRVKKRCFASI